MKLFVLTAFLFAAQAHASVNYSGGFQIQENDGVYLASQSGVLLPWGQTQPAVEAFPDRIQGLLLKNVALVACPAPNQHLVPVSELSYSSYYTSGMRLHGLAAGQFRCR